MLCCSAPAREAPGPLVPLPPCVVTAAKTKLKAQAGKFAPGPKYPGADGAEVQFKDPLEVGAALELVFKPVAAATELPGHGLPQLSKDKKGEDWINVQMPAPDAAPAGTKPLQGWVPKAAVDCPGLALNYDHLAVELMGGAEAAQRLVDRCIAVSPATRPPCNVANPCEMIQGEIDRSCEMYAAGETRPAECGA